MSTAEVIILIAAIVIVLALVAWALRRSTSTRKLERRRAKRDALLDEEHGHRVAAHRAQSDADARAAEAHQARAAAEEQAAIANEAEEQAREQATLAAQRRGLAADRARSAEAIDPDRGDPNADRRESDLAEGAPRARRSAAGDTVPDRSADPVDPGERTLRNR